jgi:hypothetical protein
MESRLHEVYTTKDISRFYKQEVHEPDLIDVVDRLYEQQVLAPDARNQAHKVRIAGNKVLHEEPIEAKEALEVFEASRLVILRMAGA